MTTTTINLDDALQGRIGELARRRACPPEALVREAIAQYVEREEAREAFLLEAEASWDEYRRTGLHLTAAEVQAWLETWGRAGEHPVPRCHG